ncbi:MAG TPA: hypothetical protein VN222_07525, partial [Novosphingobium sp.]|nr:hypothetical protein [Novosphingobium sp.]
FAPECRMLENGVAMAGLRPADGPAPCAAAFARRLYQEIEGQRPRIAAVDPQRGMVAVLACRDLPADRAEYRAGSGQPYAPEATYPRSQIIVSVLHVAKGAIARVDTVANEVPYAMPFPWAPPIPRAETR